MARSRLRFCHRRRRSYAGVELPRVGDRLRHRLSAGVASLPVDDLQGRHFGNPPNFGPERGIVELYYPTFGLILNILQTFWST